MKNSVSIIKGYVSRVKELNENIRYVGGNYAYMSRTEGYKGQIKEYQKQKKEKERIYKKAYRILNPLVAKKVRIEKKIANLEKHNDNSNETMEKIEYLEQKRLELEIKISETKIQLQKLSKLQDAKQINVEDDIVIEETTEELENTSNIVEPKEIEEIIDIEDTEKIIDNTEVNTQIEYIDNNEEKQDDLERQVSVLKVFLEDAEENGDFEYAEEIRKNIEKLEIQIEKRKVEQEILTKKQEEFKKSEIEFLEAEIEIAEEQMNWQEAEEIRKQLAKLKPQEHIKEETETNKTEVATYPEIEVISNNIEKPNIKDKVENKAQANRQKIIATAKPIQRQEERVINNQSEQVIKAEPENNQKKRINANEIAKAEMQKNITTAPIKEEAEQEKTNKAIEPWKKAVINITGIGILVANKVKDFASFISDKLNIGKDKATLLLDDGREKASIASRKFTRTLENGKETIHQLAERLNEEFTNQKHKAMIKYYSDMKLRLANKNKKQENRIKSAEEKFRNKTKLNDEEMFKYENKINKIKSEMIAKEQNKEEEEKEEEIIA